MDRKGGAAVGRLFRLALGSAALLLLAGRPLDLRPVTLLPLPGAAGAPTPRTLFLPGGFVANVFARLPVPQARSLAVGPTGILYVTAPRYGAVVALPDRNEDGVADTQIDVVTGLDCPYGLAFSDGWLYVAQNRLVVRYPLQPEEPTQVNGPGEVVVEDLPDSPCAPHGFRPLAISPEEDALYVAVGSSCNVCVESGPGADRRAKVWRYPLQQPGPGVEVARGLRNVTALAINPWDGSLWGTVAERDDLGDDVPPEMITAVQPGGDYGWPFCYRTPDGTWQRDPRVLPLNPECEGLTAPAVAAQAHSTPLGLAFHDGRGLPEEFGPSLFVAFHGSWDHSTGVGYKVMRIPLDAHGQPAGELQEFALGWLTTPDLRAPNMAWGRPVQVAVGPDGALYVSDDTSGTIYRFVYAGSHPAPLG